MKIQKLSKKVYFVYSDSSSEKYKVSIASSGKCICECKGYSFRQKCKHVEEVYKKIDSKDVGRKIKKPREQKLGKGVDLSIYENQIIKKLKLTDKN